VRGGAKRLGEEAGKGQRETTDLNEALHHEETCIGLDIEKSLETKVSGERRDMG